MLQTPDFWNLDGYGDRGQVILAVTVSKMGRPGWPGLAWAGLWQWQWRYGRAGSGKVLLQNKTIGRLAIKFNFNIKFDIQPARDTPT